MEMKSNASIRNTRKGLQSQIILEPRCWGTHRARSRARCTCIRWRPIAGRQRRDWKRILLDPIGPKFRFADN